MYVEINFRGYVDTAGERHQPGGWLLKEDIIQDLNSHEYFFLNLCLTFGITVTQIDMFLKKEKIDFTKFYSAFHAYGGWARISTP